MRRRARLGVVTILTTASFVAALAGRQGVPPPPPPPPSAGGQPQAGTPIPEGTGAISGVVIDGATDRPLGGAVVTLSGGARGLPTMRQSTDDRGRFIFTMLPASATYVVAASKIGFFETRSTRRIALTDGQWFTDAKVSLFKFGAVSGVVTDESGEPVVGAFVRVLSQVLVSGLPQLASGPAAKTDDRGMYRIPGLAPGKYLVVVPSVQWSVPADTTAAALSGQTPEMIAAAEAAGRGGPSRSDRTITPDGKNLLFLGAYPTPPIGARSMVYPITFYPAARSVREAAIVELRNGENRAGIDLMIRPVAAVRVSGVVEGPAEAEGPGMTLRLVPAGSESLANGSEAATALVATDSTFTFVGVPAGDYTIIASRTQMEFQYRGVSLLPSQTLPSPPGVQASSSGGGGVQSGSTGTDYSYRNSRGAQTHTGRTPVTVGDRDMSGVVVQLKRAVSVSGKIVYELDKPPTGVGPTSFPVYAEPADGNAANGMPTGRMTPAAGEPTFAIDGLQPGLYTLRFISLGGGGRVKSIAWDGKDYTYKALDASAGHDLTGVVVTVTDKTTRLTGYVRDAQSQIATHGSVIFFPAEPDQWSGYGFSPRRIQSSAIGSNGAYMAGSLPAGSYYAIAVDDALATAWQDPKFLAAAAPLATRVTLDWGDAKTIDILIKDVPGFRGSGGSEVPRVPKVPRF